MQRVNEQVKRELSNLIRQLLPVENHGLISVTEVTVSKDLKTAHVYVSTVGVGAGSQKVERVLALLERARGDLQRELSRKVIIKYTPHLMFKWDDGIERGQHIVEVLESLDKGQKT